MCCSMVVVMRRPYEPCARRPSPRSGPSWYGFGTTRRRGAARRSAVPDYGRFCPVSLGSEVLADRWTPLIVRELILGNTRFNDIARGLPGISRSLLVQRLRHLERKGVVERGRRRPGGATSTTSPRPARTSSRSSTPSAGGRSSGCSTTSDRTRSTRSRSRGGCTGASTRSGCRRGGWSIQFDHTAPKRQTIWMVLDRGEASVCMQHPGLRARRAW